MPTGDVVFLGAGASKSERAPLQGELFAKFFEIEHELAIPPDFRREIDRFFRLFFGVRTDGRAGTPTDFPTFEEALGVLDLALQRTESFPGYDSSVTRPRIQRARESLVYLIGLVLKHELVGGAPHHRKLIERLNREGLLRHTTFLTSNYDILIDNTLIPLSPEFDLDYGIDFTNFDREGDWTRPRTGKSIPLYKLHGSLNWLYCPTCTSMTLTPKEKRAATLVFSPKKCEDCSTEVVPTIIPPTFFKGMSNYHLQATWRRAEDALIAARRIFFCGYSFPDSDLHIKYLMKRAEMRAESPAQVFVVNGDKEWNLDPHKDEALRYKRFFRHGTTVTLTQLSFEEFCEAGTGAA